MVVKYRLRLFMLAFGVVAAFAVLVYRLYYLQVVTHATWVKKVPGESELRIRVPGVRGEIKDRNGITLVSNKPSFEVRVLMKDVLDEYRRQLRRAKDANGKERKMPKVKYDLVVQGIKREIPEDDYVTIFNEMIHDKLAAMGLANIDYDPDDLRIHTRTFRGLVPWVYRSDLTFEQFSQFAEHNLGLPGVSVSVRPSRQYPYGAMACHIFGYVSLPDDQRVSDEEKAPWGNYYVPDDYGVAGIEKTMDKYLVGKPGVRTVKVNEKGALVGEVSEKCEDPKKGNDIHLTLDARIQMIAEKALREGGIGRGAVVVLEPGSGEILAMASAPSFNPSKFVPSINEKDWVEYNQNPVQPLYCRATSGFAPGSTYKIVTALSGCAAKPPITNAHFSCGGSVTYGTKAMKCWIADKGGAHGSLDLSAAIKVSCNCFFYQYGNRATLDNIEKIGHLMGLGQRSGIELDEEDAGSLILPGHRWTRQHRPDENSKSNGFVANVSIGQGLVQASPLQMANVAATVANGGKAYPVHLLKRVMDGTKVVLDNKPEPRGEIVPDFVSEKEFELVRRGMWKVVNEDGGTGRGGRMTNIEVSGKTGTAQFLRGGVKDNHTWFIAFAPYVNPRFAVCVLVQGGKSGGGCAAPVVKRVLEQAFALDHGYQVAIEPVPELKGDFKQHEAIIFANELVLNTPSADDDGDVGAQVDAREEQRPTTKKPAAPKIRKSSSSSSGATRNAEPPKAVPVRRAGLFKRLFGRD